MPGLVQLLTRLMQTGGNSQITNQPTISTQIPAATFSASSLSPPSVLWPVRLGSDPVGHTKHHPQKPAWMVASGVPSSPCPFPIPAGALIPPDWNESSIFPHGKVAQSCYQHLLDKISLLKSTLLLYQTLDFQESWLLLLVFELNKTFSFPEQTCGESIVGKNEEAMVWMLWKGTALLHVIP